VGIGNIQEFQAFTTASSTSKRAKSVHLDLNLQVGIGNIQISRNAGGQVYYISPPTPPNGP
jgi:hypothetical protein